MSADWSFVTKPKWLLSHLFVVGLLSFFVWAGFWQVGRLSERKDLNAEISARTVESPVDVPSALALGEGNWNFRPATITGHFVENELIRVANRSSGGVAGEWSVGVFETDGGDLILVNRGFIQRDFQTKEPLDETELSGWYRDSQDSTGVFSATDDGQSERAPRLSTRALGARYGEPVAPFWLQLESELASAASSAPIDPTLSTHAAQPAPLELPPLNNGSHFSYAVQWFTFTLMGGGAYLLTLRKLARAAARSD